MEIEVFENVKEIRVEKINEENLDILSLFDNYNL